MKSKNTHLLTSVWENLPEVFAADINPLPPLDVAEIISELAVLGECYYFVINFLDDVLDQTSDNLKQIHGLNNKPKFLSQITKLVHPDDLSFVLFAEQKCYRKLLEIGVEHVKSLKSSYCFRMLVADGSYHLFHHQAIILDVDAQNRVLRSINIHTDIEEYTANNSYTATLSGIHDRGDFYTFDSRKRIVAQTIKLTKRELLIVSLIDKGFSSIQIAQQLNISEQTVRVHRKNILKKTRTNNSRKMIITGLELGIL